MIFQTKLKQLKTASTNCIIQKLFLVDINGGYYLFPTLLDKRWNRSVLRALAFDTNEIFQKFYYKQQ